MADPELFADLPTQESPQQPNGEPRLREPQRDQIELRAIDIESLIGMEHPARTIWGYVEGLDLRELEDAIKAREGRPGHPTIAPRLLLGLWLYATSEGVGSARALARLCVSHDAYRWLCGGVSVNYHTLADFRVDHVDLLDRLLIENVAALAKAGIIDLSSLTQDGVRVRASAGASSFRREATLEQHLQRAREQVEQLKRELEDDHGASNRRIRAAQQRAARERLERIQAAQQARAEIAEQRKQRTNKGQGKESEGKKEPRASTTDAQARVMKMADGGFRPAYNVQVVSVTSKQIVVSVDPNPNGSDRGLMRPALEQVQADIGQLPRRHLVDGGFGSAKDIEWAHEQGITVYCALTRSKHGTDPFAPRRDDGIGVAAWRKRMASEEGQTVYAARGTCECIHARWRNWNLTRVTVRGRLKVRAVMLLYAFANNILQAHRMVAA